ncbi:helix-turn-helix domain-containing protein [Amycolatopsis sp. DR6-1]|uniref:Helix-turn-helix domain-containing protein n=2 Tax=Amycolatopsis dendrobii TaxID=2760662 RepID=A0A7W3Z978_9PSEU|nr:helix-turn-helix domain-containing protein [Amycolatopsis dendrobii]
MKDTNPEGSPNRDAKPPRLFTVNETSERLRVSRWQVYTLINRRKLKTIRIGRRRLIAEPDLTALIESLREEEFSR